MTKVKPPRRLTKLERCRFRLDDGTTCGAKAIAIFRNNVIFAPHCAQHSAPELFTRPQDHFLVKTLTDFEQRKWLPQTKRLLNRGMK